MPTRSVARSQFVTAASVGMPIVSPGADAVEKVLLVDDDRALLLSVSMLMRRRFEVVTARGPDEAMRCVREEGPFAVVISDYWMVPINGVELLAEIRRIAPQTTGILLTGDSNLRSRTAAAGLRALDKPCTREELCAAVASGIAEYRENVARHSPNGLVPVET